MQKIVQKIVGVSFNKKGRVYNFNANGFDIKKDDKVIVETEKGLQYGIVVSNVRELEDDFAIPLKNILRFATIRDTIENENNIKYANLAVDLNSKKMYVKNISGLC